MLNYWEERNNLTMVLTHRDQTISTQRWEADILWPLGLFDQLRCNVSLLPGMAMLRCLLFSPCRDLKPENILLDDYGKSGTGRWGAFSITVSEANVPSYPEQGPADTLRNGGG